jgi:hypothetical protein
MRQRVVERLTYRSIAQRTIDFVRRDVTRGEERVGLAA